MRNSILTLGCATAVGLAAGFVLAPATLTGAPASSGDTFRALKLFGDVFERVRGEYVEEVGDQALIESAINGMLAALDPHPDSVPINLLVQVPGTPLHGVDPLDSFELVRTIATARILMPRSVVRLSAGRTEMSDELQALCLHAGASSLFLGDRLLTTPNPGESKDHELLERLGVSLRTSSALEHQH